MKKVEFDVEGMKCGGCVTKIKNQLQKHEQIKNIDVNLEQKKVLIEAEDELSNMGVRTDLMELGFIVNAIRKL